MTTILTSECEHCIHKSVCAHFSDVNRIFEAIKEETEHMYNSFVVKANIECGHYLSRKELV